ncbi:MAG: hypothetical protein Q8P12_02195, partial [bacterium]|nr:hypothetical protein [bacterium]
VLVLNLVTGVETGLGVLLSPMVSRCFFGQADRWMVIQDAVSRPVVLDTDSSGVPFVAGRNPKDDLAVSLCVGSVMHYAHGRLHYVPTMVPDFLPDPEEKDAIPVSSEEPGRMTFVSSDIRDSLNPEFLFRMSEHRELTQGGALALSSEFGFVGGMTSFRGAATGTGVGPLVVIGREGVSAFAIEVSRAEGGWKPPVSNIGQVLFYGSGTRSATAVMQINDDIIFIDTQGGLRTIRFSGTQLSGQGGTLSNTPMSYELGDFVSAEGAELFSLSNADNLVFMTVSGEPEGYFKALAVLDLVQFYGLGSTSKPVYASLYTGFKFNQTIHAKDASGEARVYAFVR